MKKLTNRTEAAALRGLLAAIGVFLGSLGIVLNADFMAGVDALIVLGATAVPILQGLWTRRHVWSEESVERAIDDALLAQHAALNNDWSGGDD